MNLPRNSCALPAATIGVLSVFALLLLPGSSAKGPSASWRLLPRAPIAGRLDASAVWTGREMLVWGGVTRSGLGQTAARSDGAAYDPATRKWRRIARSPSGVLGGGGRAVAWTGQRMVVWAGNSPSGPAGGAVYDPRAGSWRRLPRGPLGIREGYVSAWTGRELLIFGGHTGAIASPTAAAVNPRTGSWRRLPAVDAITGLAVANGAVWDGHEAFVSGNLSDSRGQALRAILFAFDPKTNRLRRIGLSRAPLSPPQRSQLTPLAWTGTQIVFSTGADPSTGIVSYSPATHRWKTARPAPCKGSSQVAWIGKRLVAACGTNALQIYTPHTNTWDRITAGISPLNSHQNSAIVWTGTRLIVWSGTVNKPGNPTPADGASIGLGR